MSAQKINNKMLTKKIIKIWLFLLCSLFFSTPIRAESRVEPKAVAVLDFKMENDGKDIDNWAIGLGDFFNLRLQELGVPTYERYFLHYIVDEARLRDSGLIRSEDMIRRKLPWIGYLVKGTVEKKGEKKFLLKVYLVSAVNGEEVAAYSQTGNYPSDIDKAINAITDQIASLIDSDKKIVRRKINVSGFSKIPEVVLLYYKGIEHCLKGRPEYGAAYFREAVKADSTFVLAQLWEIKAYEMLGIQEYVEMAKDALIIDDPIRQKINQKNDVPSVIFMSDNVKNEYAIRFYEDLQRKLRNSMDLKIFNPKHINDLTAESDRTLTNIFEGKSPLFNMDWFFSDVVILFSEINDETAEYNIMALDSETQEMLFQKKIGISQINDSELIGNVSSEIILNLKNLTNNQIADKREYSHEKAFPFAENYWDKSEIDFFAKNIYMTLSKDITLRREAYLRLTNGVNNNKFRLATFKRFLKDIDANEKNAADSFSTALWGIYEIEYGNEFCRNTSKNYKSIKEHFQMLLDKYPDSMASHILKYALGREYLKQGLLDQAADMFCDLAENFYQETPEGIDSFFARDQFMANAYYFAAKTSYDTGRQDIAKKYIIKAKELSDKNVYLQADCYVAYGYISYVPEQVGAYMRNAIASAKGGYKEIKNEVKELFDLLSEDKSNVTLAELQIDLESARGDKLIDLSEKYIKTFILFIKNNPDYPKQNMPSHWFELFCSQLHFRVLIADNLNQIEEINKLMQPLIKLLKPKELVDVYLALGEYEKVKELVESNDLDVDDKIIPILAGPQAYAKHLYEEFMKDQRGYFSINKSFFIATYCLRYQLFDNANKIFKIMKNRYSDDLQTLASVEYYIAEIALLKGDKHTATELLRELAQKTEGQTWYLYGGRGSTSIYQRTINRLKILRLYPEAKYHNKWLSEAYGHSAVNVVWTQTTHICRSCIDDMSEMEKTFNKILINVAIRKDDNKQYLEQKQFIQKYGSASVPLIVNRLMNPIWNTDINTLFEMLKETASKEYSNEILDLFRWLPRVGQIAFALDPVNAKKIVIDNLPYVAGLSISNDLVDIIAENEIEKFYDILIWQIGWNDHRSNRKVYWIDKLINKNLFPKEKIPDFKNSIATCIRSHINKVGIHFNLKQYSEIAIKYGIVEGIRGLIEAEFSKPKETVAYLRNYINLPMDDDAAFKYLQTNASRWQWDEGIRQFILK